MDIYNKLDSLIEDYYLGENRYSYDAVLPVLQYLSSSKLRYIIEIVPISHTEGTFFSSFVYNDNLYNFYFLYRKELK